MSWKWNYIHGFYDLFAKEQFAKGQNANDKKPDFWANIPHVDKETLHDFGQTIKSRTERATYLDTKYSEYLKKIKQVARPPETKKQAVVFKF